MVEGQNSEVPLFVSGGSDGVIKVYEHNPYESEQADTDAKGAQEEDKGEAKQEEAPESVEQ